MKKLIFAMAVAGAVCACGGGAGEQEEAAVPDTLEVMTFNIRMSGAEEADGNNRWDNRREAVAGMLLAERPAVVGMQEACPDQVQYLDSALGGYGRIGVGRDDGAALGEMMAVYYDTARVEIVGDGATFWLSETPDTVSKGWDAAYKRTCTYGHFRIKGSGRDFYVFNTHLDNEGPEARRNGVRLVADRIAGMVPDSVAVFITADFNTTAEDSIFLPVKERFAEVRSVAAVTDTSATYNGWGESAEVIDHIFSRNAEALRFEVLRGDYGVPYVSDHYPVVATAVIR